jgi:hypothetical protein
VGVTRTFAGVTTSLNVSPSLMVSNGTNYVWTDTVAFTSSPSAYYVLTPYILGTPGPSQALTATVSAPSAFTNVLAYNAGVGVFDVSWIGGVGVGVTYTYDVSSSGAILNPPATYYNTSVLTSTSTRFTLTSNAQKTYTVVVKATNIVGTASSPTSGSVTTPSPQPLIISNITGTGSYISNQIGSFSNNLTTGNGIVCGTYAYSSLNYTAYAFGNTSNTYTVTYTCSKACAINVLCVGGGGGGAVAASCNGGGGGGGGVSISTISIPVTSTSNTIIINIGNGGNGGSYSGSTNTPATIGNTTTASITGIQTLYGGGGGSGGITDIGGNLAPSIYGGSSGGVGRSGTVLPAVTANNNYANIGGGGGGQSGVSSGGGGGAGTAGNPPNSSTTLNGNGIAGNGIQCTLGIINNFLPSPNPANYSLFGTYYWGGGGGAGGEYTGGSYYVGGKGGGGSGASSVGVGTRDTNGINISTDTVSSVHGGSGAPNTGGGGAGGNGGTGSSYSAGSGGSGIAVIVIPLQ